MPPPPPHCTKAPGGAAAEQTEGGGSLSRVMIVCDEMKLVRIVRIRITAQI